MSQCCLWTIDLRVDKTVTTPPPTEVGDPVAFNVVWSQLGPDRAKDVIITDKMTVPAAIGVTAATVVPLTYTGGATGPASATYGMLSTSGVIIPYMPVGSTVSAALSGAVQAGYEGVVLSNTATGAAPGHNIVHGDTHIAYTVVNSTQTVVMPLGCYLKCTDVLGEVRNIGAVSSASVCIGIGSPSYVNGRAIFQARNGTMIQGTGALSGGGAFAAYLQTTYTNPFPQQSLLEVDMQTHANFSCYSSGVADGNPLPGRHATFVHCISENLNEVIPNFGGNNAPVPPNWAWTVIESSHPSVHFSDSSDAYPVFGVKALSQASNSCMFRKLLAPGQSVTLYSQWWVIFYNEQAGSYVFHGGMAPLLFNHRNVVAG